MVCKRQEQCKLGRMCGWAKDEETWLTECVEFIERVPLTNEEWLRNADTEQLAEWIAHQTMIALLENQNNHSLRMTYPAYWVEWLKQPHTKE